MTTVGGNRLPGLVHQFSIFLSWGDLLNQVIKAKSVALSSSWGLAEDDPSWSAVRSRPSMTDPLARTHCPSQRQTPSRQAAAILDPAVVSERRQRPACRQSLAARHYDRQQHIQSRTRAKATKRGWGSMPSQVGVFQRA